MTYYSPRWDLTQAVGQRACSRHNTREKSGAREGGREGSYLLLSPSHTDTDIIIHYSASGQDRTGQVYQAAGHSCWWKMVRQQTLGQVETGEVELLLTRSQSRSVFHSSFSLGEIGGWWSSVATAHMSGCVWLCLLTSPSPHTDSHWLTVLPATCASTGGGGPDLRTGTVRRMEGRNQH